MTAIDGNKIGAMLHVYCIFTYYINILQSYGILVFHIHPIFGWHLLSSFYGFTYYFSHTYAGILRRNFYNIYLLSLFDYAYDLVSHVVLCHDCGAHFKVVEFSSFPYRNI